MPELWGAAKEASNQEWEQPKGKSCVAVNKDEELEMQSLEFAQLVFGLAFVQYFFTMMFWNGNVYPVP